MGNTNSNGKHPVSIVRRISAGSTAGGAAGGASGAGTHELGQTISMSRSPSGTEISEKGYTPFVPLEKLSKLLQQKTQEEYHGNGIIADVFVKKVFPEYPDLGFRLFNYLHMQSKAQTKHMGAIAFRQQCERFLAIIDDTMILENYTKIFCDIDNTDLVTQSSLRSLLMTCFQLAMAYYSDGANKYCPLIERTLNSVTASCFFTKESLSCGFVCRWLEHNCPRLITPVHRFVLHTLSTAYRGIENGEGEAGASLELATPVLDNMNPFDEKHPPLMPVSQAWLLASVLPPLYTKPQSHASSPATPNSSKLTSTAMMMKMLSVVPSHWTLLYDSNQHGVGSNRFLHHVLGYKGPTLCMFRAVNDQVFCIASPNEWKESHLFTGDKECCLIQVLPKFQLVESGPKLLYLNTCMRGYPKGLKAGSDPQRPLLVVDEYFEKIDCRGISSMLQSIEVWGCGDKKSRDTQLDIKKWQIKEAERQRTVKLTAADWLDNPDRYLLELGGRPQYNNN